jgi:hypothetical protein
MKPGAWLCLLLVLVQLSCVSGVNTSDTNSGTTSNSVSDPAQRVSACVPDCGFGLTQPGRLPSGYRTEWFFGGMMTASFDGAWESAEDSTAEFRVAQVGEPNDAIFFWLDVYAVERFERVRDVPLTADGIVGWLGANPNLDASEPRPGAIGGLPATVIDVSISRSAENDEGGNPYCERRTCINYLGFDQWDRLGTWGIAGDQVHRLYLSNVRYGGGGHLFVAAIAVERNLESFAPRAEAVIASVRVPVEPG